MNKIKTGLFLIAITIFYISCTKEDTLVNPDPDTLDSTTIMGFKDSTQLVKSYTVNGFDSNGVFIPGSTNYIFYDTVQRKITIMENPDEGINLELAFYYNGKGLLIKFEVLGVIDPDPPELNGIIKTIEYIYDASDILKSGTLTFSSGNKIIYSIIKTVLPDGNYKLSWENPWGAGVEPYGNTNVVYFDKNGNLLSYYDDNLKSFNSVTYDNNGNINKIIATFYTPPYNPTDSTTITLFEFTGRSTKGSQFHNFFQILFNGIANLPGETAALNRLIFFQTNAQYFKYPANSTNINIPEPGSYYCSGCPVRTVNFNNVAKFDDQNRIVSYRVFSYVYRYSFEFGKIYDSEMVFSYYK